MKNIYFQDKEFKNRKEFFENALDFIHSTSSKEWTKIQKTQLLQVFKEARTHVTAYKKFLVDKKIQASTIRTYTDFINLPPVNKNNYLRAYDWEKLCKTKSLITESIVMTATSGSTGTPFYFPRNDTIDIQASFFNQMFLTTSTITKNKSILVIDCFGMGIWLGGLITYQSFKDISRRGYKLTIITPGVNKEEILKAFKNIGKYYDQIILCGYPPFVKDIVDYGKDNGLVWKNFNIKVIFAAEAFSETFRDYIVKNLGIKNMYRDTVNIYGSADLGTMAQESPLCILLRRLALENQNLYMKLFGQATRLPTLAQYVPGFTNFEEVSGSLYCTGDNILPLVRYDIGDNGGVFTYNDLERICKEEGVDLIHETKKVGIEDTVSQLPFVYVYERSDFSASFYGALIYPEHIKKGLTDDNIQEYITGKFTMYTKNDEQENQYLEINIEQKPLQKINRTTHRLILKRIHEALIFQSSEYKKITEALGERAHPKLVFWNYGDATHFSGAGKQRWVKK